LFNFLEEDRTHADAAIEIATIFTLLQDYEKAKKYYTYALNIEPDNQTANLRYGKICHSFLKEYDEALKCYQRIIHNDPNHFKSFYQLGLIKLDMKNPSEAQEYFKNCLKINNKFSPAWKCLGMIFYDSGKCEKAVRYFEQAAQLEPRDAEARVHLGNCYYELQVSRKSSTLTFRKLTKP
jgi:tetratricopeptide (TPR) repeat protein